MEFDVDKILDLHALTTKSKRNKNSRKHKKSRISSAYSQLDRKKIKKPKYEYGPPICDTFNPMNIEKLSFQYNDEQTDQSYGFKLYKQFQKRKKAQRPKTAIYSRRKPKKTIYKEKVITRQRDSKDIFKFLTVTHQKYFDLSFNFQERQGNDGRMQKIASLLAWQRFIWGLNINLKQCKLKHLTYEKFWDALTTLENLRKLNLNIVNFIDLKPITLFQFSQTLTQITKLEILHLDLPTICDDFLMLEISKAISNLPLQELVIGCTRITSNGISHLAKGLKCGNKLKTLHVNLWGKLISDYCIQELIKTLKEKHLGLEQLAFFLQGTQTTSVIIRDLQQLINQLDNFSFIAMTYPDDKQVHKNAEAWKEHLIKNRGFQQKKKLNWPTDFQYERQNYKIQMV